MTLPKSLISVTPFSKFLALVFFVMLPFLGFFFGMAYQQQVDNLPQESVPVQYSSPSPTPTPTSTKENERMNYFTPKELDEYFTYILPSGWVVNNSSNPQFQTKDYKGEEGNIHVTSGLGVSIVAIETNLTVSQYFDNSISFVDCCIEKVDVIRRDGESNIFRVKAAYEGVRVAYYLQEGKYIWYFIFESDQDPDTYQKQIDQFINSIKFK